jgi:hypothetical protein
MFDRYCENLHLVYRKTNPQRPVDWRWQLAKYLSDARRLVPTTYHDGSLRQAHGFIQELAECSDEESYLDLSNRFPDCYEAWKLYNEFGPKDFRWEIEARLLARNPAKLIAEGLGLTERTVDLYESWFFNVRDRLSQGGYITHHVIGPAVHRGFTHRQYDSWWKIIGYYRGSPDVDNMIESYREVGFGDDLTSAVRTTAKHATDWLALIAIKGMPIDAETRPLILDTWLKVQQIDQASRVAGGAGQGVISTNVMAFLEHVPWRKHLTAETATTADIQIHELRQSGICLRSSEMAYGELTHETIETLKTATYPDPFAGNAEESLACPQPSKN